MADLALVPAGASGAAYRLGVPEPSDPSQTRTSPPRRVGRTDLAPKIQVELVLLVEREWGGGRPWAEPASVPVSVELRRVWTPGPFRLVGGLALLLAFVFFLFSRSGPRD